MEYVTNPLLLEESYNQKHCLFHPVKNCRLIIYGYSYFYKQMRGFMEIEITSYLHGKGKDVTLFVKCRYSKYLG